MIADREQDTVGVRASRTTAEAIGRDAIAAVVDDFYDRIQHHPTLAGPFRIIRDWPAHKAKMTHFWWLSLGGRPYLDYRYAVMPKHAAVGVTAAQVDAWLALFDSVVRAHVTTPEWAEKWLFRARRMGDSLRLVEAYYRRKQQRPDASPVRAHHA